MATISRSSIRALIRKKFKTNITKGGIDELARILEDEAKSISAFSVQNARKNKRDKVTRSDIRQYLVKGR
jgi:histone H3/H4